MRDRAAWPAKVANGEDFTLEDFLEQMQPSRRWARSTKLLGMLPGMGDMKAQLDHLDEREIDRIEAIIQSMTPAERQDPKILNGSRRARIARGSGTEVQRRQRSSSSASARRRR